MIQILFPVMIRGRAYGITTFVARSVSSTSTIFVEYTDHPLYFVIPFTLVVKMFINLIKEVDFENEWVRTNESKEVECAVTNATNDDDEFI